MSQTSDNNSNNEEVKPEETSEPKNDNQATETVSEEKMQVDATPERRPSQNSEANNDVTPIQTDNDEVNHLFFLCCYNTQNNLSTLINVVIFVLVLNLL